MVTPDGAEWAPRPRVDNAMVKALARAFRWRKMLDEGVERLALRAQRHPGFRVEEVHVAHVGLQLDDRARRRSDLRRGATDNLGLADPTEDQGIRSQRLGDLDLD